MSAIGIYRQLTCKIRYERLSSDKKVSQKRRLVLSPVSVENLGFMTRFCRFWPLGLFASLVSSGQGSCSDLRGRLQPRNRTSRFRFCTVAAR